MLKLQGGAADQGGNDSEMNEELRELKDENEKLRRSLALLHTYSLKLHKRCETLAAQSDGLLDECEAAACLMRQGTTTEVLAGTSELFMI